jgi:ATPase subunit of ABC transporter with duplicated ATPase domains
MGAQFIFQITDLTKKFGQRELLKNINVAFYPGAKIGLLGRNGAGKSTLMKIMAGIDAEYEGEARLSDGFSVGYLEQEPELDAEKTVFENVMDGVTQSRAVLQRYEEINASFAEPLGDDEMEKLLAEQATVQDEIDAKNLWDLDRQVEIAMDAMNLPPGDWGVANLSGGERRRVALCRLLLEKPDLLLLDEPTNHLDAESVLWLEHFLAEYTGTVVAVTHDRYFLDNVAKWILEVDHGRAIPFEGNYSSWLEQKQARMVLEEKQASARQKTLTKELEWIRMSPKARQAKSKASEWLLSKSWLQKKRQLVTQMWRSLCRRVGHLVTKSLMLRGFPRHSVTSCCLKTFRSGCLQAVLSELLARMVPGKRHCFECLLDKKNLIRDRSKSGRQLTLDMLIKAVIHSILQKTVFEEISGGHDTIQLGKRTVNARSYVAKFNFMGPDQQKKVGTLSGGERNRVHLAKLLRRGANLVASG